MSPKLSCPLTLEILHQITEAQDFLSDHRYDLTDVYSDFLDELEEIQDPRTLPLQVLADLQSVLVSMGIFFVFLYHTTLTSNNKLNALV